jgi:hypothetical protein
MGLQRAAEKVRLQRREHKGAGAQGARARALAHRVLRHRAGEVHAMVHPQTYEIIWISITP